MNQRQLIEVDPQRIKFNPLNPRKHRGAEYTRLRDSIKKIGIVQLPTVRVLAGGFYEVIDGEGRVSIAQEEKFPKIWAVSVGFASDEDAMVMLHSANTTRSFNFLAECKGLANMHRQRKTSRELAKQFKRDEYTMKRMIAIGYLPGSVTTRVEDDINRSEEQASIWTPEIFKHILLLRELLPGKSVQKAASEDLSETEVGSLDGLYDYTEVERAIEQVTNGKVKTGKDMHAYVIGRRYDLQQERFHQNLQERLKDELTRAKEELQKLKEGEIEEVKDKTKQHYEDQVKNLESQLKELERQRNQAVNDLDKHPEIIEQREKELEEQIKVAKEEHKKLQEERTQLEGKAREEQERLRNSARQRLVEDLTKQREEQEQRLEQQIKKIEDDLKDLYAKKEEDLQFKAENTIRGLLSQGVKKMAETQQTLEHAISDGMFQAVEQLGGNQLRSLLAQAESLNETLDRVRSRLKHGDYIALPEGVKANAY